SPLWHAFFGWSMMSLGLGSMKALLREAQLLPVAALFCLCPLACSEDNAASAMANGDSGMTNTSDSGGPTTSPDGGSGGGGEAGAVSSVQVSGLLCEYLKDPLGIDTPAPRLSWALDSAERGQKQTAYQIVVSDDTGDLWDTGKVVSAQQAHVAYA